ncbi:hypothetical protein LAX69_24570, partial [Escherichia coli]|nr:hypothetical protein [Escherichia coli]
SLFDDEDTPPNPKKEIFNTTHYRASAAMEYPYDVPDYAHMAMEASEFHPSSGINAEWPLWPRSHFGSSEWTQLLHSLHSTLRTILYCPTSVSMQQPGQQATELAMQNSVSAVVARIRARSCGTPMPFASQVPVQNSESGRGYTIGREYPCMGSGSAHASILAPVCASLTFCVIVGKSLHMFGK